MRDPRKWLRDRLQPRTGLPDERGFTLIEMVVVIVILPLVIGAAAAIIIASQRNSNSVSGRLSDSSDAQLTAANFVRDVQGASLLTTDSTATAPAVCGSGTKLLLGLNRSGANGLSVGYWEVKVVAASGTTYEVVRDSCVGVTTSSEVVSQSVNNTTQTVADIATPNSSYGNPANGWIPSAAVTTVPTSKVLTGSGDTISLASTAGFAIGTVASPQKLVFLADLGTGSGPFIPETVKCTGGTAGSPGTFTGCSLGSGTIDAGTPISQPSSVTAVHLALNEVSSSYTFGLRSTPRVLSSISGGNLAGIPGNPPNGGGAGTGSGGNGGGGGSCCGGGNGGPALLTLGPGVSVQGGANSSLTVNGLVSVNGGTLGCTGGPTVTASGYLAEGGASSIAGCATGPVTQISVPVPDPLAGNIPVPFPASWTGEGTGSTGYTSGPCPSGIWNIPLPSGCALKPGLFVLNGGYCTNNGTLTMAAGSGNNGVLLYVPPNAATCSSTAKNCTNVSTHYSFDTGGNASFNVPGLLPAQAQTIFGSTGMTGVALWQDINNANNIRLGGTTSGITPGALYARSSLVTLSGNGSGAFGQVIASCVSLAGSTPMTVG